MKKIVILFCIVLAIVVVVSFNYINYKNEYNKIQQYNLEFDKNYQQEIYGIDLTTLINKVINNNKKNNVEIDQNGIYIDNNIDSINIVLKIIDGDEEQDYPAEIFYNGGIERFVQYYGNVKFKCTKVEYHKKTGKVKYLYFEQISK